MDILFHRTRRFAALRCCGRDALSHLAWGAKGKVA